MSRTILAAPLAALTLLLAPAGAHAHHEGTAHPPAEGAAAAPAGTTEATLGDLTVEAPWSRATPPMANVAAGYLTIRNSGDAPARLLGGASRRADRVEIHSTTMENDVMRMRELADGIEVPADGEVLFAPGGHHLMLVGLDAPLAEGERVPLTLRFDTGTIDVELDVRALGAPSGAAGHGGH